MKQFDVLAEIKKGRETGVFCVEGFSGDPDDQGVLAEYELTFPFSEACYFAGCQKRPINYPPEHVPFPDGFNQAQPGAMRDWQKAKLGGIFLVIRLHNDRFLALVPMTGKDSYAWFVGRDGKLIIQAGHLGTEPFHGDLPVLAWAVDGNVYRAVEQAWRTALGHPTVAFSTRPRTEKHYPEIFTYLGWCSWEEYKKDISEEILGDAFDKIENSDIPIRYALIDDGHIEYEGKRYITKFDPDPKKFPNGWKPLTDRKKSDKIRWMGLWLNFNGYWDGINPQNELGGEINSHLSPVPSGALQPSDGFLSSVAFYDAFIGHTRVAGFDYVKVDNQAKNTAMHKGAANAIRHSTQNSQALEQACARHLDGLINCMAHNHSCVFNTRIGNVTRCSEDYKKEDLWRAKFHLYNSYANSLWMGQTVWCDHDMFHANDPVAGEMMAISKALSGGPVYLSDDPAALRRESLMPLCYEDGRLLRTLAPAVPLPESVFIDPMDQAEFYRVIAPLPNGCAAVAGYNLTDPENPVEGSFSIKDYRHAGGMLQDGKPEWDLPEEGLILYDWKAAVAHRLDKTPYPVRLEKFDDVFALLCPIRSGWAPIGRSDKYLSPASIEVIGATNDELILRVEESGPVLFWSESGTPKRPAGEVKPVGESLWQIDLPVEATSAVVKIQR
ncbi:raffinose synthase [bacterium]|nr:raffinose synthase [bacterium]